MNRNKRLPVIHRRRVRRRFPKWHWATPPWLSKLLMVKIYDEFQVKNLIGAAICIISMAGLIYSALALLAAIVSLAGIISLGIICLIVAIWSAKVAKGEI